MSLVNNIETVIPQRMPFVMISELIHSDTSTSTSTFEVKADNIFLKDHHLQEPALVENIAQTAAARAGYMASQEQRPVAIGYIAAIQNLEVLELPVLGDRLNTVIKIMNQVFDVTLIGATVSCGGKKIATCEMKIFITKQS
jgi:3-hydroxymyristoyl/3-hydroxydecanoyl-(acyl carrier protein) dehydratase